MPGLEKVKIGDIMDFSSNGVMGKEINCPSEKLISGVFKVIGMSDDDLFLQDIDSSKPRFVLIEHSCLSNIKRK